MPKKDKKEMFVTCRDDQCRLAITENSELVEVYIGKTNKKSVVGNIYVGRITAVLPGMSAAFVDIGVGKNALLYLQDLVLMEDGSRVKPRKIGKALKQNDTIVAQVTKDPMQNKGARITTNLSLPGRLMVYMPRSNRSGVSRRLPEKERERLRRICKGIKPEKGSVIIRTAAMKAKKNDLQLDLEYLLKQWKDIQSKIEKAKPPTAVYTEPKLAIRVIRDALTQDFARVLVDDKAEFRRIREYVATACPEMKNRVEMYKGKDPLFKKFGIDRGIEGALRRKVSLPSGGHIVIDKAEALTAIDVNTGSFTGKKSLEETVLKNNLEAAVEVVKQLRLRDIGGIIVIDFIDMEKEKNRAQILETLEKELASDRTKTQVVTLSELGLVEMTRKNVTDGIAETLGKTCPHCEGRGLIFKK